jgi:CDP-glycerol glycerophosphotransferase (TagB/SpsB family)
VKKARRQGRKIIFYAGQNDWGSGMIPAWISNAKLHSPCFADSIAAFMYLHELARQNNWHILFKPHPLVEQRHRDIPADCFLQADLVPGANIFDCIEASDVVVTILSGISYIAMIHQRPVVLLGRTHLYKKGCAYEVFTKKKLDPVMRRALQEGFSPDRQRNWLKTVARLLKYYLYSLDETAAQIIGRDVHDVADFLCRRVKVGNAAKFKKKNYILTDC